MLKFAANLSMMYQEYDFLDRFKAAADDGFTAVEFLFPYDYPAQTLKAKLTENQLTLALFNTTAGNVAAGEWGLTALPNREADARAAIDDALDYAIALDCPTVHIMAGVVPPEADRNAYLQTFISNLEYASDRFAPHNITICLEALSPVVKPNYLLKSQLDTLQVVEQLNRANIKIQFDYFHAQIVDGNLTTLSQSLFDKIGHIQIASVPDRHEPDEGEIAYPYIFETLKTLGYRGYIGCEYKPRGRTTDGLVWFKSLS